ncbi:hypothetical protein KIW84_043554 [Lathyrus oleraceus]|uniref:Uncharacterized protein n=1 Tax=Pisum sativum TaxID=3888 RepID=A0A9D5AU67_PEA|nr:hypothetical protein KIW84_043554 [Pisum sativum]
MVKTKGWEQEVILCIPHQTTIKYLCKEGGTLIGKHEDIEEKIIDFYGKLMGKAEMNLNGFDIVSMRKGNQVTIEQRNDLIMHVTETEIVKALKYIGDKRAPGIMHKVINGTLANLLPKTLVAKAIRDYRPITCCSTIYKVIS